MCKEESSEAEATQEEIDEEAEQIGKSDPAFASKLEQLKKQRLLLEEARQRAKGDEQRLRQRVQEAKRAREEQEAKKAKEEEDEKKRQEQEDRRRSRAEAAGAQDQEGQADPKRNRASKEPPSKDDAHFTDVVLDVDSGVLGDASSVGGGGPSGTSGSEEATAAGERARKERKERAEARKKEAVDRVKQRVASIGPRATA